MLFAAEEHPQLLPLILRKFSSDGDVETAQRLVQNSRGIERTRELAASHAQLAMDAVREQAPVLMPMPIQQLHSDAVMGFDPQPAVHIMCPAIPWCAGR